MAMEKQRGNLTPKKENLNKGSSLETGTPDQIVENLIQFCASTNTDPFEYAQRNNINLSGSAIKEALLAFSTSTYEEDMVFFKIGKKMTHCCEGMCRTNLCPRRMLQNAEQEAATFEQSFNLLMEAKNASNIDVSHRKNLLEKFLRDLTEKASSEQELNLLLEQISEVRTELLKNKDEAAHWIEGTRFKTIEEYIDYDFDSIKSDMQNKLNSMRKENE